MKSYWESIGKKKVVEIDADLYDALELSAYVHGGIGWGYMYSLQERKIQGRFLYIQRIYSPVPCCIVGHRNFVMGPETFSGSFHSITEDFWYTDNDAGLKWYLEKKKLKLNTKVDWETYCEIFNIKRVENK